MYFYQGNSLTIPLRSGRSKKDRQYNRQKDKQWSSNHNSLHKKPDCVDVSDVRQNFYNVNNLCDLFTNVAGYTILKILKENWFTS